MKTIFSNARCVRTFVRQCNSETDSEFNAEEFAASHPNRNFNDSPNADVEKVDELDLAEIEHKEAFSMFAPGDQRKTRESQWCKLQ